MAAEQAGGHATTGLHPALARQFCFLQFRCLCELIALGCLIANGHMKLAKSLRNVWRANELVDALEALHSDFYPQPVEVMREDPSSMTGSMLIVPRTAKHLLTKSDLKRLYGIAGDELHIGKLQQFEKGRRPSADLHELKIWWDKIDGLLREHQILLKGGRYAITTHLFDPGAGGEVRTYFGLLTGEMGMMTRR